MKLSSPGWFRAAFSLWLLVAMAGSGCARLSGSRDAAVPPEGMEAESAAAEADRQLVAQALAQDDRAYRMQPGDEIDVQVYREPDISGVFRIGPVGEIRHPLLGNVQVAGLSVSEAENLLVTRLEADYLVNPRVLIKVLTARSSQIVIFGEVKKPGIYPVPVGESITLLQAIAQAGGFTELASPDRVRIVRQQDGKQTTLRARVADILGGRGGQGDIPLQPDDVIVVPQIVF